MWRHEAQDPPICMKGRVAMSRKKPVSNDLYDKMTAQLALCQQARERAETALTNQRTRIAGFLFSGSCAVISWDDIAQELGSRLDVADKPAAEWAAKLKQAEVDHAEELKNAEADHEDELAKKDAEIEEQHTEITRLLDTVGWSEADWEHSKAHGCAPNGRLVAA
jgi:hypothetical protein